ncbi:Gx transporter family protein [Anaerococcus sp. Marseille-Q7828]|uniref:Gx transporter family protein n=1 Tax=Anaerococcus sp. Marseille-Q7828 TaxID=3036300 RepID=UPI0024AD1E39|nr:Gx transporter family protein [Anaerococcus sp. Marseille-Q7828]
MKDIRNVTNIALLTAMALAISLLEHMIPLPVPIPGAKLGFSNMIILITLYMYGFKSALLVGVLKSFLLMLITGSVSAFFYSIAGAILSAIAMAIALKYLSKITSFIGISEIGAFFHNLGQILVAMVFMGNVKMIIYFPALVIMGVFTSFFVGLSVNYVTSHMKKLNLGDINNEKDD